MILKSVKFVAVGSAAALVLGGLVFGSDVVSYVKSSANGVRESVRNNVPIEFELRRARDLLDEIIPEMHATVELIAVEEVEVEELRHDIARSQEQMKAERVAIAKLRHRLNNALVSDQSERSRIKTKEELSRRFDRFKQAADVYNGKERLLKTREQSLAASLKVLDKTESRKATLESKIEGLEAQYRLVQAASIGSPVKIDNSKIAKTEKLISDIKKRLDVAERVLSHEARFIEPLGFEEVETVNEEDLLSEVDDYFNRTSGGGEQVQNSAPQDDSAISSVRTSAEYLDRLTSRN
jgi:hypothetical protein